MKLPDLTNLLPSQARAAITAFFLALLKQSRLGCYGDPVLGYPNAMAVLRKERQLSDWEASQTSRCFDDAMELYDQQHPKVRDNEAGRTLRKGIG